MAFTVGLPECLPRSTRHSQLRQQQRGKKASAVRLLFDYHDMVLPTKNGCKALQMSKHLAAELKADGHSPQVIEAAMRTTMIVAENENIVTLYRARAIKDLAKRSMRRVTRLSHIA